MKISKKIFACVLTVCMLLTMFAGVLSASAAVAGSATIGSVEIAAGEVANVPVTLTADAAIGGADLYIAFPENATVSAAVATEGYSLEYLVDGSMAATGNADLTDGVAHFVLLASDDAFAGATTVEITLAIAGLTASENVIAFAEGTLIGTTGEVAVAAELVDGVITVIAECAHAETKDVVTEAATCGKAGTMNIVCVACDAIVTEGVVIPATGEHNYVDGVCDVCGAEDPDYVPGPVLDEAITPAAHSVSVGETFGVGFRFDLSTIKEEYTKFRIDIKRTTTTGDFNFSYDEVSYDYFGKYPNTNLLRCRTTYYGIQLFSLTAPIEYTLHCFDDNNVELAYSETFTTTLAEIAVNYHDLEDTRPEIKRVMADLIQVGAAALKHYTNNGTRACDYSTLPIPSIESDYITTELGEMATFNSSEGVQLTIAAAVQQNAYFNIRFAEKAENKEQYRYEISYYDAVLKKTQVAFIEGANLNSISNNTMLTGKYETFPLFATNAEITVNLYKNGEVVGTAHYCIDTYITQTMAKANAAATLKTMLQELGELGQSVRASKGI